MRRTAQLLAGIALLSGCGSEPISTEIAANARSRATASEAAVITDHEDVAVLRRVTDPYHSFQKALDAGYSVKLTDCLEMPPLGGMGFHYGKAAFIDGKVSVAAPEVLLYEHVRPGKLELLGVEYIVPYTIRSRDDTPPVLYGQRFRRNDVFQLWALHVWAWKQNPSGLFADWNPRVTCEHSPSVSTMAHH